MGYIKWVIENKLARASRPGYSEKNVAPAVVAGWIEDVQAMGVKSIICLLTNDQLGYYPRLPEGLLGEYQKHGFQVAHIAITDPAVDPAGYDELERSLAHIYERFQALSKPVLIHCSAGVDRTGRAVRYIMEQLDYSDEH
jgi:protein-tyrosine phosphatase